MLVALGVVDCNTPTRWKSSTVAVGMTSRSFIPARHSSASAFAAARSSPTHLLRRLPFTVRNTHHGPPRFFWRTLMPSFFQPLRFILRVITPPPPDSRLLLPFGPPPIVGCGRCTYVIHHRYMSVNRALARKPRRDTPVILVAGLEMTK